MTTSSSSCALRGSLQPQSALNGTMCCNWLVRSPTLLPQILIQDPWWSGVACGHGPMKRDTPTTARSGSSSDGSTPLPIVATSPLCSRAYAAPQEPHAPSLTPSWSTVLIVRVHVMLSFCGWRPRLACGAWRSLRSRPVMYTRMLTAGTSSCEGRGDGRELYRSRLTWLGQSPTDAHRRGSSHFLGAAADIWPPIPSHRSDAVFCLAHGRCTSYAIGTQRRRTRPSMTCSRCANSWAMHRSRRPSATSHHPPELATQFSQQPASTRQHNQTTRQRWQCWQCQPPTAPTISEKRETIMHVIVIANALFNLECEVEQ